ncbi:MAG: UDP-N-acetylmuramoyl-L-alanyl-D-glutamate--2,6-diaminopimelate ligase [Chromatiales bacterium]|jgi:UDP-N-acetylmuramoyl-L-alanyl-D-glutamate--2,6-diaminopimelate ligase
MMNVRTTTGYSLRQLLDGFAVAGDVPDMPVAGLSMDSRMVAAGDLFLAAAGGQTHGLQFARQAVDNGAIAVLAESTSQWLPENIARLQQELAVPCLAMSDLGLNISRIAGRFYQHPSRQIPVIGITGTNGKTSCSQFIAQAFAGQRKVAVMGTLGNGFPGQLTSSTHTTMDPVSLQAGLALLLAQQAEMVAMEVSSHALHQGRVADIDFDVAVLTNFSRDHLDYHGTMTDYANAKSLLFRMPQIRCSIINADDELGLRLLRDLRGSHARLIAYAVDHKVDTNSVAAWLRAEDIKADHSGLCFTLRSSWGEAEVSVALMGRFNIYNLLVTLGVLLECGVPFAEAVQRLQQLQTVTGRMQLFGGADLPTVVVDFAHTPDALQQALSTLREHTAGELVCVFGCGGDRDAGKRPQMGAIAEKLADVVVLTDDNPRTEDGDAIIADIRAGMQQDKTLLVERNRALAIRNAITAAQLGDLVLVAGKGHEAYQIYGDIKQPFSDQEVVGKVLRELSA